MVVEIDSHLHDVREQAVKDGASDSEADLTAWQKIGDEREILAEALSKPELKSFACRHGHKINHA